MYVCIYIYIMCLESYYNAAPGTSLAPGCRRVWYYFPSCSEQPLGPYRMMVLVCTAFPGTLLHLGYIVVNPGLLDS